MRHCGVVGKPHASASADVQAGAGGRGCFNAVAARPDRAYRGCRGVDYGYWHGQEAKFPNWFANARRKMKDLLKVLTNLEVAEFPTVKDQPWMKLYSKVCTCACVLDTHTPACQHTSFQTKPKLKIRTRNKIEFDLLSQSHIFKFFGVRVVWRQK